ncbi:uncharacterized protein TM35_000016970 [Trypanosoma theileri]|uniref:Uncharacterized protein n=1 Tax=Trypanosoma theileri TaxID=67003 RepID=A0A1X0PBI9_9TRYP|nr:uncharacterized protein TM35_000016970 [Trypanosoma theileri]ORC93820.1 hypothetical protein TM35_000016970 [Trypanosoma theileri]
MQYLRCLFLTPEEALSRERVRNEIAREKLSGARLQRAGEEEHYEAEVKHLNDELQAKRDSFAAVARPLLTEYDDVFLAQHYYQEVSNILEGHVRVMSQLADRELEGYGYVGKRLVGAGLHLEALRVRLARGEPFRRELSAALRGASSPDLAVVAAPLMAVGDRGVPPPAALRATGFDLARAVEAAGSGPARGPPRGWLDLLKFRTSLSPTMLEMRQAQARRAAAHFLAHVEKGEYRQALDVAETIHAEAMREGVPNAELLDSAFTAFRNTVLPALAADMFLRYSRASLDSARYACVEKMLMEE